MTTTITIIRDRAQVATASTATLVATYNALTGNSVERFSSREVAERRTDMAIMAAEDAAAHRGLAPGQKAVAATVAEVAAMGPDGALQASKLDIDGLLALNRENPFKPGTMAHQLWVATASLDANSAPRAKKPPKPKSDIPAQPRRVDLRVRALTTGVSRLQASSVRKAVFDMILAQGAEGCLIKDIDAAFEKPMRGYVHKLMETKHLEAM